MVISKDLEELWYDFRPVPGAKFKMNETVKILNGNHSGQIASIISLETIDPEPKYLIELNSGEDMIVAESNLELIP